MENLSARALDEAIVHRFQCEKNSVDELHKLISEEWLPKHLELSKGEEAKAEIIEDDSPGGEDLSQGKEGSDKNDSEETEKLKDPNKIEETLRNLRNFCSDKEPLDPRIQELLTPGNVLLSINKAVNCSQYHDGMRALSDGARYLCFVHKEKRIKLWHIALEMESYPYKFTLLEKIWFYRKGRTVVLSADEVYCNTYKFETNEGAAKFEQDILVAGKFCHFPILRLSGELPAQQLICKWCLGGTEYEKIQLRAIYNAQEEEEDEDCTAEITANERELMDNIRRRTEDFVKYAQSLLITLFIWNSGFSPVAQAKTLTFDVSKDLKSVIRLLPFLNGEGFSKFLFKLGEDLYSMENSLITCHMMIKCNEVLNDYFYQALDIDGYVWRLLVKYVSLDEREDLFDVISNDKDLQKELFEWTQMCETLWEQESPQLLSPQTAVVNCVEVVCEYLVNQRGFHGFPKLFDKLDNMFRAGNDVLFDVLCRNFKKEMFEALLPLKTVSAVGHELFEERPVSLLAERAEPSKFIRLSELQDRPNFQSERISSAIANDENVFCLKVKSSIVIFESILTFIENGLGFKKEVWMKLLNIRNLVADQSHTISQDTDEEEGDNDVEYVRENNTTEDFSFCEDAYETILQHPRSWNKYIRNVFVESDLRPIKELSSGAYGEASLMHHLKWKRVVLKLYHFDTDDIDKKKEIDMLISLQGNQNIVRLYGFYYQSKKLVEYSLPLGIVMEYVELTLHGLIHDRKDDFFKFKYSLKTALQYLRNMASAFSSMHNLGFYHRDIKPKNILMTYEGDVRICDFGTCGHLNKTFKTGQLGTHQYKSPEMLNIYGKDIYNEKTDVYSLAVTIWELIHRRLPYYKFKGNSAITDFVCAGKRLPIEDSTCTGRLKDIIQRSWAQLPSDRPTMSEIEIAASALLTDLSEEVLKREIT